MMNYEYRFKGEDFIPIVGLRKHHKRCVNEMFRDRLARSEEYVANASMREGLLSVYNLIICSGTILGITGLVSLLSK